MSVDLGLARAADVQSFGEPGQRTFRLRLIGSAGQSAALSLEKEHLAALVLAFREVLSQGSYRGGPAPAETFAFPEKPDYEFRVGSIGVGYDGAKGAAVLQFGELEGEETVLAFRLGLDRCAVLIEQMESIIAAGRPLCPLCGGAVDATGHVCVRTNGHSRQPIPEPDGEDDEDDD